MTIPSTSARLQAYACLALSMALVGSYVALSRPLLAVMPVLLLAWLRFGIAAVAMLHWLRPAADEAPMTAQTRRLVFLESFFGNFLFSICMLYGVQMTSAVAAGVVMACIPALVALLSWLLLRERLGRRILAAVACAMLSIALLAWSRPATQGDSSVAAGQQWLGSLLLLAAVVCEALYAVIGKKLTGVLRPHRISALINLWGLLLMTPLGIHAAWDFRFAAVPAPMWLLLLFYALAASIGTVWLWMRGLQHVPAARAGVFTVLLPVTTTLIGTLVLGESISAMQLLACLLALSGVLLATLPQRMPAPEATPG